METIKLKLNGGIVPAKGSKGAAAYDLFVATDSFIKKGRQVIPLYFSMQLPKGYCAKIMSRSGIACKGIQDNTGVYRNTNVLLGLIDEDYRGTVGVLINNHDEEYTIQKGTRIAQMLIEKVEPTVLMVVEELDKTERGAGGFGSTGK